MNRSERKALIELAVNSTARTMREEAIEWVISIGIEAEQTTGISARELPEYGITVAYSVSLNQFEIVAEGYLGYWRYESEYLTARKVAQIVARQMVTDKVLA